MTNWGKPYCANQTVANVHQTWLYAQPTERNSHEALPAGNAFRHTCIDITFKNLPGEKPDIFGNE